MMECISDLSVEKLEHSPFVKPARLRFKHDGKEKIWDIISTHESVYVILFNKDRKKLVFVKQFRPAVYFASLMRKMGHSGMVEAGTKLNTSLLDGSAGITLELCAGIIDKNLSPIQIAAEEIEEECGYKVPTEKIEPVKKCFSHVGTGGSSFNAFYAEVTDEMKTGKGGGNVEEGEMIEVVEMSINEAKEFLNSEESNTVPATLFGIQWFLLNKT